MNLRKQNQSQNFPGGIDYRKVFTRCKCLQSHQYEDGGEEWRFAMRCCKIRIQILYNDMKTHSTSSLYTCLGRYKIPPLDTFKLVQFLV